ncbi:TfoX/Sxy family protein [Patescibacteria group bacterium]|nr:TfoX/Sxy family protein [Patescibacteria group bacterium]
MATKQSTVDFIEDQLSALGKIGHRKMFGDYALYHDGRVVGFVCDDTLFLKITPPGKIFAGNHYQEGHPYPGAKPYLQVDGDRLEQRDWLTTLVRITSENLPKTTSKSKKKMP